MCHPAQTQGLLEGPPHQEGPSPWLPPASLSAEMGLGPGASYSPGSPAPSAGFCACNGQGGRELPGEAVSSLVDDWHVEAVGRWLGSFRKQLPQAWGAQGKAAGGGVGGARWPVKSSRGRNRPQDTELRPEDRTAGGQPTQDGRLGGDSGLGVAGVDRQTGPSGRLPGRALALPSTRPHGLLPPPGSRGWAVNGLQVLLRPWRGSFSWASSCGTGTLGSCCTAPLTRAGREDKSQQPDLHVICSFVEALRLLKAVVNAFKGI